MLVAAVAFSSQNLVVTLVKGKATFNNLFIDYSGLAYRLLYSLSGTTVQVTGTAFDVVAGDVTTLKVSRAPGNAWAGGQPFQIQPYIDLVDFGSNTISSDSATVVTCTIVPSLAVNEGIVVTTTSSQLVNITKVTFSSATLAKATIGDLGPGDLIEVDVRFSHEVTATYTSLKPYLTLSHSNAWHAKPAKANLTNPNVRTENLRFTYIVEVNDASTDIGYLSFDSILLGDGSIRDNLGRAVNDTMRQAGGKYSLKWQAGQVNVDQTRPRINRVHTDLTSDEYGGEIARGEAALYVTSLPRIPPPFLTPSIQLPLPLASLVAAGHLIPIDVNFTRPVSVIGTPVIPLMVNSTVNVVRTNTTGNITDGSTWGITYNGESRNNIPWNVGASALKAYIEALTTVSGTVCVMRETAYNLAQPINYENYQYGINLKPWVDGTGYNWIIQVRRCRLGASMCSAGQSQCCSF